MNRWIPYGGNANAVRLLSLPGRSPHLPQDLIEAFREFSVTLGIPQDSFFTLTETGKPKARGEEGKGLPRPGEVGEMGEWRKRAREGAPPHSCHTL